MLRLPMTYGRKQGRPPVVTLTGDETRELQSFYLATNKDRKEGSISTAWVLFCESRPEKYGHLVADHVPATGIPAAVREACLAARSLVGPDRGGAQRLRHESASVPGTMRLSSDLSRRLYSGEQFSVDDATRNVACWVPWPWGGCKCSEKFGVRLGRWQTLVVHDDASDYIPVVSSVYRYCQSYRGSDAAHVVLRTETDVGMPGTGDGEGGWIIEGGVWSGPRVMAIIAGRAYCAKGRPNQKLVEAYFNRLWARMSLQRGDVGRHRGEIKAVSELYVKCRAGLEDPRRWFMSRDQAQESLYSAIRYLSEKRQKSPHYGTWIPRDRWESDLEKHPRPRRSTADLWLSMPVRAVDRTVSHQSVRITETGPLGVPMIYTFSAPWLAAHEGRKVDFYFDPLAEWPLNCWIAAPDTKKLLGVAECINPVGTSVKRAAQVTAAVRSSMTAELRIITTGRTERLIRTPDSTGLLIRDPSTEPSAATPAAPVRQTSLSAHPSRILRETSAAPDPDPRQTSLDAAASLARRAAVSRTILLDR